MSSLFTPTYELKKMGLQYEVGLNIKTGHICWQRDPLSPGNMNNDMILNDVLTSWIGHREQVEADLG